ncbi:hypothetical protein MRB53_002168 [Persea americana]|uniref:Uncharacterized protein n=1 Tax=Persea americana TaxID=3435 RepID=A0ACC2MUP4_PERAE|nr:hypothetical protein MRB53_002168 [Persea americana]
MGGGSSQWICQWVVTVKCSKTPFQLNLKIRKPFRLLAYKQIIENTLQESKEILIDDKGISETQKTKGQDSESDDPPKKSVEISEGGTEAKTVLPLSNLKSSANTAENYSSVNWKSGLLTSETEKAV